jgi:SAM-dependent methyltransferase
MSSTSACVESADPSASIVPASRPSEKFGTDSSGNSTRVLYEGVKAYYDRRAREYDDWWLGRGMYADRERPGWEDELRLLEGVIRDLPPTRTLDVACGTGFLTRHLRGDVVGLDASESMLEIARGQAPQARFEHGDALYLPFEDDAFDRVFTSYFYCHLETDERERFLAEARRVAPELVVVASIQGDGDASERWEDRRLEDGSQWNVYKRVFEGPDLADELQGEIVFKGRWFVVVRA